MSGPRTDLRHRAREAALQILYQWELAQHEVGLAARTFFEQQWVDATPPAAELKEFATDLAVETVARLAGIDRLIAETSERWRPERMPVLDRLILRLAVCELQREGGVPAPVVINEALELARTFSTEDAVKFINGMLDGIRKKIDK